MVAGVEENGETKHTSSSRAPLSGVSRDPGPAPGSDGADERLTSTSRYSPGVVFVSAKKRPAAQTSPFALRRSLQQGTASTGSGFVIDEEGDILTNFHVVEARMTIR